MYFEVYTELSRKQFEKIQSGDFYICIPDGVQMVNEKGSRSLYFYCEKKELLDLLIEGIEDSCLNYDLI